LESVDSEEASGHFEGLGTSATQFNPDYITELEWWEHPDFAERHVLEAAEMVAFQVLDPALRSRGAPQHRSRELYAQEAFRGKMQALFEGAPAGRPVIVTLEDALERIAELEALRVGRNLLGVFAMYLVKAASYRGCPGRWVAVGVDKESIIACKRPSTTVGVGRAFVSGAAALWDGGEVGPGEKSSKEEGRLSGWRRRPCATHR
jgi:hypothetical protein